MCGIFKWNVLLLSYTNKIEAVTLKQIKNKFNQSSVSTKQTKKTKKEKSATQGANTYESLTDTRSLNFHYFKKKFDSISLTEKK